MHYSGNALVNRLLIWHRFTPTRKGKAEGKQAASFAACRWSCSSLSGKIGCLYSINVDSINFKRLYAKFTTCGSGGDEFEKFDEISATGNRVSVAL